MQGETMPDRTSVPPFDSELAPTLEAIRGLIPPFSVENLPASREAIREMTAAQPFEYTVGGKVRRQQIKVPGPEGAGDVLLEVFHPARGTGPWPLLYNTHGGGMVNGDALTEIPTHIKYVAEGLAVLVGVDYRLAPENPDPAPIEDCYAGLAWVAQHSNELEIDLSRIIVIGASAGGGLAAGVALLARDRGFPTVSHQVLIAPMLDDRFETPSSTMLDGAGVWDFHDNKFGWTCLLGDRRGGSDVSVYAAPARAEDLTGLPSSYIDVGGVETFRDEAILYATRLLQAGVSVDLHVWAGGFHGYDFMAPDAAISQRTEQVRSEYIHRALRG
jgi:acetyl esterase/lipase